MPASKSSSPTFPMPTRSASLTDFLSNARYGCGFPAANIGNLTTLQNYAYATGLFISPALVASQAANDYLGDFSTGLNGEFVWSSGLLTFVPYGDTTISGYGKTYTPPARRYIRWPTRFPEERGHRQRRRLGLHLGRSSGLRPQRASDAYNDVKVEYLDRGNSYNPAIAEAQDDAAIDLYGLRPADTKQLHFFCTDARGDDIRPITTRAPASPQPLQLHGALVLHPARPDGHHRDHAMPGSASTPTGCASARSPRISKTARSRSPLRNICRAPVPCSPITPTSRRRDSPLMRTPRHRA